MSGTREREGLPGGAPLPYLGALLALALLTAAAYAPATTGPFVFDDHNTLVYNTGIRHLVPLRHFLGSNRPLTDFLYALTHAWAGGQPRAYHLVSVVLHLLNTTLVWLLARRVLLLAGEAAFLPSARTGLRRTARARPGMGRDQRELIAIAAAGWFASHPVHVEAVAYIASQSELLAACFYLAAVLLFASACLATGPRRRLVAAAALPVATAAALGAKEMAVTLPLALVLFDLLLLHRRNALPRRRRLALAALSLLPFLAALPRLYHLAFSASTAGFGFGRIGALDYFLTQPGVIWHYARLALLPYGQCFDYDWPLVHSPASPAFLAPATGLAAAITLAWRQRRRRPLVAFAILWPLLVLLPTSSVVPLADPVAERRLYLALFAPAVLLASGGWQLCRRATSSPRAGRVVFAATGTAVVLALAAASSHRAALWRDPLALYAASTRCAPGNPRAHLNYGATLLNAGEIDAAERELRIARELFDRGTSIHAFPRVGAFIYYNLGVIAFAHGRDEDARSLFRHALELGGRFVGLRPMASFYLGHIARRHGRWEDALAYYTDAYANSVTDVRWTIRLHLARALLANGKRAEAERHLRAILEHDRGNRAAAELLAEAGRRRPPGSGAPNL